VALLCLELPAQGGGRFRSPSSAEFEKPPLIAWQRNLDDALAEVAATGKPLLICVNMDGEIACDQLAARNYRNAEFAALTDGFVPVIASPARHNESDYDADGQRIPCPRFGRVICSEHIDIEPILYRAYFAGERVAPRHLAVTPEGETIFDLYLLNRLRRIDESLKKHGMPSAAPTARGEALPLDSADAADRSLVEDAFAVMPEEAQIELLEELGELPVRHPELQRLAIFSDSKQLRRAGIESLSRAPSLLAVNFFERACDEAEELGGLEGLIQALAALAAEDHEEAKRIFLTRKGLASTSRIVNLDAWTEALVEDPGRPAAMLSRSELETLDGKLEALERRSRQYPSDGELQLEIAATNMRYGLIQLSNGHNPSLLFQDALSAAERAEKRGAARGLALAYQSWSLYFMGDVDPAGQAAEQALPELLSIAESPLSAEILGIFASYRTRALYDAMRRGNDWSADWVADIHSAYRALALHGAGRVDQAAAHIDWLVYLNAFAQEGLAVEQALARFPRDPDVQECWRRRLLREEGPAGLITGYQRISPAPGEEGNFNWFAGYASLVAAEQFAQGGQALEAMDAYGQSIILFERSVQAEPSFKNNANHFMALALAGRARMAMGAESFEAAVGDVCAALARRPDSAEEIDGLGNTPLGTALLLAKALADQRLKELARSLKNRASELGFDLATGGD
jgi:tetratricopeptide (TPR) repeat protein